MTSKTDLKRARIVVHQRGRKEVHSLGPEPLTVGRSAENDVPLADPRVSRFHLRIEEREEGWQVLDVGSQNGTLVNGRKIRRSPLTPGDVIKVGAVRLLLELPETAETAEENTVAWSETPTPSAAHLDPRSVARLGDITKTLNAAPTDAGLLSLIIDAAIDLTGSERGFLIQSGKQGMEFATARNIEREDLEKPEFQLSWSIAIRVGTSGESVLAINAADDDRFRAMESVEALGLRSVLCVPIRGERGILGVIYVDNMLQNGAYTEDDRGLLETLADQAGIALNNRAMLSDLRDRTQEVESLNDRLREEVQQKDDEIERIRTHEPAPASRGSAAIDELIGDSARMEELRHLLGKVAATDFPVLVQGESGTGKELVARIIHESSARGRRSFVTLNCAAVPESLLENELFGHVRGAFTGADATHQGLFEAADGGTLFLDEVSEMAAPMQSRLLRVLQEGEVRPVGGKDTMSVDVRVIAASNRDLARLVEKGRFRQDLYFRLRVLPVAVPPLRQRREDITDLVSHFFRKHNEGRVPEMEPEALDVLCSYAWPGNVRELENEVKRLAVLAGSRVDRSALSRQILEAGEMLVGRDSSFQDLGELVESIETREIRKALTRTGGNKTRAATLLGISRFTLQRKLEKYGIGDEEA